MNLLKKGLLTLLVLLLAGAAYYFLYYQKTPEYSVITIQQAYKNKDLATFQKHVDLDKLLGNLFDDAIVEQTDGMELEEKGMVINLARLLKKPFVNNAKANILKEFTQKQQESVEKTLAEKNEPPVNTEGKNQPKNLFKNFSERLKPNKMVFKGTGSARIEGSTAYLDVTLYDTKLAKDYTFTAQMLRLSDKTWKLVRLENANIYLRDLLGDKLSTER